MRYFIFVLLIALGFWGCKKQSENPTETSAPKQTPVSAAPAQQPPVAEETKASVRPSGPIQFTDITSQAGIRFKHNTGAFGKKYLPETMGSGACFLDYDNDGWQDILLINSMDWPGRSPGKSFPALYHNNKDGTFTDVTKQAGLAAEIYGLGCAVADYDNDGKTDIYITTVGTNHLFHNLGNKFEEVAFQTNVALAEDAAFISGMGTDFRDVNNDGFPDIVYVALKSQTFPIYLNTGKSDFAEATAPSGMRALSMGMSGFGPAFYDFDNDGWKDLFVTRGQVTSVWPPGFKFAEPNVVFRNLGSSGKWQALTSEAGFTEATAARHRGCAFGDFDGNGRIDIVATGLDKAAELWMNRSPKVGHWLDISLRGVKSNRDGIGARIRVVTKAGVQYNHQTSSVCYASSSLGPVHFGLGAESTATKVEITWPSGIVQSFDNVASDQVLKVTEPDSSQPAKK